MAPIAKRIVNEEPEAFRPSMRMAFVRWGVPFEINVDNRQIVARYDTKKMEAALAQGRELNTLFARAELARKAGDVRGAIALYEQCKPLLPSEDEDVRRNINLRLYPLYTETARWGHQASDWKGLEEACRNMGATATNPTQEIRALMAYGELHERLGAWLLAAQALQNASRHYWREPLRVSNLETRDRGQVRQRAELALDVLIGEAPPPYREQVKRLAELERRALDDYFLSVANVDADLVVETRWAMANRLRGLLARTPGEFRVAYERAADEELKRYEAPEARERLLWCWPESAAGRARLNELEKHARGLAGVEQQAALWRLGDLAQVAGLGVVADADKGLRLTPPPTGMPLGAGLREVEEPNEAPDTVRLALPQAGETEATAHLLFTGGRRRQAYGNRFTVKCRDLQTNRKLWETGDILLHGRTMGEEGFEAGFERVLVWRHLAIVHGRFDTLAVEWAEGKGMDARGRKTPAWRFRVPLGFEIERAGLCGDVLILCGQGSTLALSAETGEIVWEEPEAGSFYAGPFFEDGQMLTVRNSPSEVSFRHLGSGRLLARVRLPGLTTNRSHPVYALDDVGRSPAAAEAAEGYPVAFGSGALAVTDGTSYHVVDLAERRVRWSTPATNLDLSRDPAYRLWIDGGRLFVLKPYYSVLENVVFDLASGDRLWRRREGGKRMDDKLKDFVAQEGEEGKAATGLVLGSMVFVDGRAYGIRYEMGATSVTLVGMDPATGNETMRVEQMGYQAPEAYVETSWSQDAVAVRVQDENKFEVWQVDVKNGKLLRRMQLEGHGRLGEYGEVSAVWQGPYQALWAFANRKVVIGKP